jgi:hypothetical protein
MIQNTSHLSIKAACLQAAAAGQDAPQKLFDSVMVQSRAVQSLKLGKAQHWQNKGCSQDAQTQKNTHMRDSGAAQETSYACL